ncbi:MAG TPA: TonB-dependent receptor [Novosphingobium sp.]|nr:TonB-dependent receptor [Novosphingobium sp.]
MRLGQILHLGLACMVAAGSAGLPAPGAIAHAAPAPHAPQRPAHDDDDDDGDDGPVQTGAIVVTARQLDAARASINPALGASAYLLTNDAVEKRPSGETANLVNVLLQMPGVSQGGDGAIRVRGQDHVQYRLNNIILPDGLADPADTLRARFADRVELVTGALPAQYGLQTGGIVNLTTKSGVYQHDGEVELYGGTQGRFEPAFELAGAEAGTSYYVSGAWLRSDAGLPAPDASATPLHDHTDQGDALAYFERLLDARSRLALILGVSDDGLQTPRSRSGPASTITGTTTGTITGTAAGGAQQRASQYGLLSYLRSAGALNLQLAAFLSHGVQRLEGDVPGDLALAGIARQDRADLLSSGLQAEAVYAPGRAHHLRAGLLASWRRTRSRAADTVLLADSPLTLRGQASARRQETGLYLQDEWAAAPGLTFNYGLRFDRVSGSGGGSAPGPRASLVWSPAKATTFHLGYARYFVPAPQEREAIAPAAYAGSSAALPTATDTPARAERDDYIDIGLTQKLGGLALGIDAFWRGSRNLLDQTWSADGLVAHAFNYARGTGKGVELSANWSEGPLSAWGNLAVSRLQGWRIVSGQAPFSAAALAGAASQAVATNSDQRFTGSAGLAWRTGPWRLSGDATFGSGLPRSATALAPNGATMPAWVALNLAAVRRFAGWGRRPLDIRLDVLNALDGARRWQDGTGLAGGQPQWAARRGVFIGLEQAL